MSADEPTTDPHADTAYSADADVGLGATATDIGRSGDDRARVPGPSLVGQRLAHFEIEERIGRGGMGEVYRATDLALDRPVAVKVLASEIAEDERLRERFYREARSQARIQHPNVCHIYYIGEQDGRLFFAMEYVDGESLSVRLERDGKLPADEAVELCRMAALGLREAHLHGFTHRDVKPSNLMVDSRGVLKVVDFGLVVKTEADGEHGRLGTDVSKTSIVGTPLYMAPEQARGDSLDLRSDIYALGATLHHLVSGSPPFVGDTPHKVVSLHETEQRPAIQRRRRRLGPASIDVFCDRMMAKQPAERFDDYDQLVEAMENLSPARTRAAGFWVRAFALVIDLILLRVVMIPLQLVTPEWVFDPIYGALVAAYFIIGHGRYGRTLGKSALELEVVTADRHQAPGLGAAAVRFLFMWAPIYLLYGANTAVSTFAASEGTEITLGILLGVTMIVLYPLEGALSAWLVPGKRTFWDRRANTRVRYQRLALRQRASGETSG